MKGECLRYLTATALPFVRARHARDGIGSTRIASPPLCRFLRFGERLECEVGHPAIVGDCQSPKEWVRTLNKWHGTPIRASKAWENADWKICVTHL